MATFTPAKEDESSEKQQYKSDSASDRASDNSLLIVTTGMYCILVTLPADGVITYDEGKLTLFTVGTGTGVDVVKTDTLDDVKVVTACPSDVDVTVTGTSVEVTIWEKETDPSPGSLSGAAEADILVVSREVAFSTTIFVKIQSTHLALLEVGNDVGT